MQTLITFCRGGLTGKIVFKKIDNAYFLKTPIDEITYKPIRSLELIYDFLKKMDTFLYSCEEITYLYFFYEVNGQLQAVRYSNYFGSTEITHPHITELGVIETCDRGYIHIFEPSILC